MFNAQSKSLRYKFVLNRVNVNYYQELSTL